MSRVKVSVFLLAALLELGRTLTWVTLFIQRPWSVITIYVTWCDCKMSPVCMGALRGCYDLRMKLKYIFYLIPVSGDSHDFIICSQAYFNQWLTEEEWHPWCLQSATKRSPEGEWWKNTFSIKICIAFEKFINPVSALRLSNISRHRGMRANKRLPPYFPPSLFIYLGHSNEYVGSPQHRDLKFPCQWS